MKIERIVHIPWTEKSSGIQLTSGVSRSAKAELKALARFNVPTLVVGREEDWKIPASETFKYTGSEGMQYAVWDEKWAAALKSVTNSDLIIVHNPFIVNDLYTKLYVPGFKFPKIVLRYHSNPTQFSDYQLIQFLMPMMNFPCIFGSDGIKAIMNTTANKKGLMATADMKKKWLTHHVGPLDIEGIDAAEGMARVDRLIIQPAMIHLLAMNGIERVLDVGDRLFASGVDFNMHFNLVRAYGGRTENAHETLGTAKRPYISVNLDPDRSLYYSEIKSRDIFLSFAPTHTGGLTFLEMLVGGMIGVFWKSFYVEEKVGKDYPFVANSTDEAVKMIRYIQADHARAKEMIRPFVESIRDTYTVDKWNAKFIETLKKACESYRVEWI